MAQHTGGKNFWGFMQTLVVDSGLAAAAGEAVATHVPAVARSQLATAAGESVARSLRRSALEVVPPSELGLVLLASRLTNLAYCATTPEAIAAGVSTLLVQSSLVWFKQQDPHSGTHDAQWYLARGTLPPGVDGAAPGGPALFLVFRGTQSMNDVMNDVMATPKAAASGGMFHEVSTTSIPSPNASPNPNPNPNPAPRGLPACGGGGRRAARATRRARRGQAPCTRHARAVAHAMHTPCKSPVPRTSLAACATSGCSLRYLWLQRATLPHGPLARRLARSHAVGCRVAASHAHWPRHRGGSQRPEP